MDILVSAAGVLEWRGRRYACALGGAGVSGDKREGDGATPAGAFLPRRVLYRADRVGAPLTPLPTQPIAPDDGWCDDPADAAYNRPVKLPYPASREKLWRQDDIYDLVVVLGHNDDPVIPGGGSAIFVHVARSDYAPTRGCVALARDDLLEILKDWEVETRLRVEG